MKELGYMVTGGMKNMVPFPFSVPDLKTRSLRSF